MSEQRAKILAYSAAATAACVSLSALCVAYASLSGVHNTRPKIDSERPITINNYSSQGGSNTDPENDSGGGDADTSKDASKPDDTKSSEVKKTEPRYKRVIQFWNEREYTWEDREEKKLTPEEEEQAKKYMFTAKIRQSRDNDEDPIILLAFNSEPLRLALKDLLNKHVPEIHEENPEIDSHELFHKWDAIKELVEETTAAIEQLEKNDKITSVNMAVQASDGTFEASEANAKPATNTANAAPIQDSSVELLDPPPRQHSKNVRIEIVKKPPSKPKRKKLRSLQELKDQKEALQELLNFLDSEFGKIKTKLARFKAKGIVDYRSLWTLFPQDQQVVVPDEDSGEPLAFVVNSTEYVESMVNGKSFSLTGQNITWKGDKFIKTMYTASIKRFRGQRTLASLKVEPLSDTKRKELTARGRKYAKYCGSYYLHYEGDFIMVSYSKYTRDKVIERENGTGRVMVDRTSYKLLNPNGYGANSDTFDDCGCAECMANAEVDLEEDRLDADVSDDEDDEDASKLPTANGQNATVSSHKHNSADTIRILEEELCLLPPTHFGFSFALRMWGQMTMNFSDIQFDHQAFDQLVMEDLPKTAIRSLVDSTRRENYQSSKLVKDLIQGKGGGLICVLFGTPGTGKTLTAEAVAEHLQRPLYIVSSGQLGYEAGTLEASLQKTLDLADRWDCVTLIDEADVFLEARSTHEMQRNALVAVFLKALERFHSTLFLTTNRVETFDPAFISRFSIAVKYSDLDTSARKAIWKRFLDMAGVTIVPTPKKKQPVSNGVPSEVPNGNGPSKAGEMGASDDEPKATMTEKQLDTLAEFEINGRQVKQIVRSAQALALANKEPLGMSHCKTMLDFTKKFAAEFKHPGEIDYSAKDATDSSRTHLYR